MGLAFRGAFFRLRILVRIKPIVIKYQNIVVLPTSEQPTMSSLEMVDYINAERKAKAEVEGLKFPYKKYRRLQHNNFMAKTPKVLGENQSTKFLADYTDEKGRTYPCYRFFKREACLMAMSYSYELQAQVFDHMTALEGGKDINLLDFLRTGRDGNQRDAKSCCSR
ncbi:hypothetical protein SGGMMB4_02790 [Sodalis glossinidius str. 'morsitans']|uniref:Hypothetical phage protein n=1 Tax=Sodalis glossinidius (strain morsitans) TaxID=343509 RepID=Q2NTM0_SODGM|nr:hypothetical phage protein [Sodalis glossinidius str. 'morsitans']CRL45216.1 hypothetical protein SGGMMB4_02790 [Sodalis glossinidius str. 'morsitans']